MLFTQNIALSNGIVTNPGSLLTTTRAQTVSSYAANSSGLLIPFAANTPRITDQGLLVEEARTNLFTFSTPLIANLASSGGTLANGSAPATNPLPFATQWLTMGAAAVASFAYPPATLSITTQYTASFYVKMADNSAPRVSVGDGGANFDMAINIANNPAGVSGITVTLVQGSVYRITGTLTTGGSVTQNHGILQYSDMSGKSFQVSQFQIEAGAFATSPIPTSGGTATRAADAITFTGVASTAVVTARAAYFITNKVAGGSVPRLFNGAVGLAAYSATTALTSVNGGAGVSVTIGSGTTAGIVKSAFGFSASGTSAIGNGGVKGTNATAWPGTTAPVFLGNRAALSDALNGYMQRATFGPTMGQFDGLTA